MRFHGESAVNFEPIASIFRKMTSANYPNPGQSKVSDRKWKTEARKAPERLPYLLSPLSTSLFGPSISLASAAPFTRCYHRVLSRKIPAAPLYTTSSRCVRPHTLAASPAMSLTLVALYSALFAARRLPLQFRGRALHSDAATAQRGLHACHYSG